MPDVDPHRLRDPGAGGVEEFEQGGVPTPFDGCEVRRLDEMDGFVDGEGLGERLGTTGRFEEEGRIGGGAPRSPGTDADRASRRAFDRRWMTPAPCPGGGHVALHRRLIWLGPLEEVEILGEVSPVGLDRVDGKAGAHVEGQEVFVDALLKCQSAGAQTEASALSPAHVRPRGSATAGWQTDSPTTLMPPTSSGCLSTAPDTPSLARLTA